MARTPPHHHHPPHSRTIKRTTRRRRHPRSPAPIPAGSCMGAMTRNTALPVLERRRRGGVPTTRWWHPRSPAPSRRIVRGTATNDTNGITDHAGPWPLRSDTSTPCLPRPLRNSTVPECLSSCPLSSCHSLLSTPSLYPYIQSPPFHHLSDPYLPPPMSRVSSRILIVLFPYQLN